MSEKLKCTRDYTIFDEHPSNRPLHEDKVLEKSMREHGFMPSSPIQVIQNGNGKLKIIRGHHRFNVARRLGLPIWYVIDDSNVDMYLMEASSKQRWSLRDFIVSRAQAGDEECLFLLEWSKATGISINAAASLIGGESSGSANMGDRIKSGTFRRGDMAHAGDVAAVVKACQIHGVRFATDTAFVNAVSRALRIHEFSLTVFLRRLNRNPNLMKKRSTMQEYLEEIEALYNHMNRSIRLAVKFRAEEVMRDRQKMGNVR